MILRGEAVRELVQLRALRLQPAASAIELVHVLLLALPRQLRGLAVAHEPRALLLLVLLLASAVAAVAAAAAIFFALRLRGNSGSNAPSSPGLILHIVYTSTVAIVIHTALGAIRYPALALTLKY
jgi:hypothetical protein